MLVTTLKIIPLTKTSVWQIFNNSLKNNLWMSYDGEILIQKYSRLSCENKAIKEPKISIENFPKNFPIFFFLLLGYKTIKCN